MKILALMMIRDSGLPFLPPCRIHSLLWHIFKYDYAGGQQDRSYFWMSC